MPHPPAERRFAAGSLIGRPIAGYGLAIAATALALAFRLYLEGVFPAGSPFLTFFPGIVVTSFLAGTRPGIACAALSLLAARFFLVEPLHGFALSRGTATALLYFAAVAAVPSKLPWPRHHRPLQ